MPDLQRFLDEGWDSALLQDDRVRAGQLMAADGPTVADAANAALDGSPEDVRKFLDEGFDRAWLHDERIRVGEAIAGGGPVTVDVATRRWMPVMKRSLRSCRPG